MWKIKQFIQCQRGATAIEYGLICVLMVISIIAAITNFGDANNEMYNVVTDNVDSVL